MLLNLCEILYNIVKIKSMNINKRAIIYLTIVLTTKIALNKFI